MNAYAYICDNCDWTGDDLRYDLAMVPDLNERVHPGEIVPAGECPECGCLAHAARPDQDYAAAMAFVRQVARMLTEAEAVAGICDEDGITDPEKIEARAEEIRDNEDWGLDQHETVEALIEKARSILAPAAAACNDE